MSPIHFISWQRHRRSVELADALGVDLKVVDGAGPPGVSHIVRLLRTIPHLVRARREIVIVQNPSRVLAALAVLLKPILRYRVVVDRHSNFRLRKPLTWRPSVWFIVACSELSIRGADLTIVTNRFLARLVRKKGGSPFVLTDRIPRALWVDERAGGEDDQEGQGAGYVLYVCTFSPDEPWSEVLTAAKYLKDRTSARIKITGKPPTVLSMKKAEVPSNVDLLGFVSETEYTDYMRSADAVLVLTDSEWVLTCGAYEAVASGKPLIVTGTKALREYYGHAAVYCRNDAENISAAIVEALTHRSSLKGRILALRSVKDREWCESLVNLKGAIETPRH